MGRAEGRWAEGSQGLPMGTRVAVLGSMGRQTGIVQGPSFSQVDAVRVQMDPGCYDEDLWPDGVRVYKNYKLEKIRD